MDSIHPQGIEEQMRILDSKFTTKEFFIHCDISLFWSMLSPLGKLQWKPIGLLINCCLTHTARHSKPDKSVGRHLYHQDMKVLACLSGEQACVDTSVKIFLEQISPSAHSTDD